MIQRLKDFFRGIYCEFYKLFTGRYPEMDITELELAPIIPTATTSTSDVSEISPEVITDYRRMAEQIHLQYDANLVAQQQLLMENARLRTTRAAYTQIYGPSIQALAPPRLYRDDVGFLFNAVQQGFVSDQYVKEQFNSPTAYISDDVPEFIKIVKTEPEKVNPITDQERKIDME